MKALKIEGGNVRIGLTISINGSESVLVIPIFIPTSASMPPGYCMTGAPSLYEGEPQNWIDRFEKEGIIPVEPCGEILHMVPTGASREIA